MTKLTTTYEALLNALRKEFEKEQQFKLMKIQSKPHVLAFFGKELPEERDFTRKNGAYINAVMQAEWETYSAMVRIITKAVLAVANKQENAIHTVVDAVIQ